MTSVFSQLVDVYGTEGLEVMSGLNATLVQDFFQAPFTWLVRDGKPVTDGLGIAPAELYLVESLAAIRPARRILVIGNAFGWSTLALALANQGARVVAIDAGYDENSIEGLGVTNRLARKLGVDAEAVEATSPADVPAVVAQRLGGSVDLAFIDGFHVPEQLVADWRAVRPFLHAGSLVLMHDVLLCDLVDGYQQILAESGWHGSLLHGTTSGMGVAGADLGGDLGRLLAAFAGGPRARQAVADAAAGAATEPGHGQRAAALRYLRQAWQRKELQ